MLLEQIVALFARKCNLPHYVCFWAGWTGTGSSKKPKSRVRVTVPPSAQAQNRAGGSWPWRTRDSSEKHSIHLIRLFLLLTHLMFTMMGSRRNGLTKESFILSVDVGTTSIRCHVYDKEARIRGSCTSKVLYLHLIDSSVFTRYFHRGVNL